MKVIALQEKRVFDNFAITFIGHDNDVAVSWIKTLGGRISCITG
jgi:hypothetical protein